MHASPDQQSKGRRPTLSQPAASTCVCRRLHPSAQILVGLQPHNMTVDHSGSDPHIRLTPLNLLLMAR